MRTMLMVLVVVLGVVMVTAEDSNATVSFLDCVSAADAVDSEADESLMGRALGCARLPVVRGLRAVHQAAGGDLKLWDGAVVLHRMPGAPQAQEAAAAAAGPRARSLDADGDLAATHDVIAELDRVSRTYAMDVEVYPGVRATLNRDGRSEDAVNLSFKLDGLAELARQNAEEDAVEEEDGGSAGRDIEDYILPEDRHGHKKKKVLKGLKKLKKKLAKYLPLLAIPLAIQMLLLPLYILALKMMALKSILLGKMTLMLVAFNILRNVQQRQLEDDHNSRVAAEYYGYQDDGVEYGGWVNRRRAFSGRSDRQARQARQRRSTRVR